MSNIQKANKEVVQILHVLFKKMGHHIPLGHIYEALSRLAGLKSWNVAKAMDADLAKNLFEDGLKAETSKDEALKRTEISPHTAMEDRGYDQDGDGHLYAEGYERGRRHFKSKLFTGKTLRNIKEARKFYDKECQTKILHKPWYEFIRDECIIDTIGNLWHETNSEEAMNGFFDAILERKQNRIY